MIFCTGSQLVLEAAFHRYLWKSCFENFQKIHRKTTLTECYFSKVAVLETANSDRVFEEHFAPNHCFQQYYWFVYIEKTKFPESYFVSDSLLKSFLFSVI